MVNGILVLAIGWGIAGALCFAVLTFLTTVGVAFWRHVFSAGSPWRTFGGWSQLLGSTWRIARITTPLGFGFGALVSIFGWLVLTYLLGMLMGALNALFVAADWGMLVAITRRIRRRREPKEQRLRWDIMRAEMRSMLVPSALISIVCYLVLTLAGGLSDAFTLLINIGGATLVMFSTTMFVALFDVDSPSSTTPAK